MKKLLLVLAVSGCACLAQAETMSFITVLSSPVGSFNRLETADPSLPAYGKAVNFCTQVGNGGVVELKGTQAAVLGKSGVSGGGMYLSSGTTLGKTDHGKYSLSRIDLKSGGNVKGGRLFGNTVTVGNAASGRAEALYGNTLTIAGAKTKTLNVNSGASQITAQHDAADMVWSNEYQDDAACKTGSACAKQYLLKSANIGSGGDCANSVYRQRHKSECCPSWPNTEDPVCYKRSYVWTETLWKTGFNQVAVNGATQCTDVSYNRSAVGAGVIHPMNGWSSSSAENMVYSPLCGSDQKGMPCESTPEVCYIALGGDNWIADLKAYYTAYNMSFPTPKLIAYGASWGCIWDNIQHWPQLECAQTGPFVKNGW